MNSEAQEIHRRLSESVIDMLNEYRLQAHAGPVTDKALQEILFRASHGVVQVLAPYSGPPAGRAPPGARADVAGDLPSGDCYHR